MLCILCRLHQELQALRVQKDSKHRDGERLAAEQDTLFRKASYAVLTVSTDVHWHATPLPTLLSCCCTTLGCRKGVCHCFRLAG